MGLEDTHGLGYEQVDGDPNLSVLLATMDATARWEATLRLRRWERDHLQLRRGMRLLDVGCGLGDVALALAGELGVGGEVVGVDASAEMLRVARARAASALCPARFSVGDAGALDLEDRSFDVVRSERTLQWLADPVAAVAELARVVRPGGRISLIDTDWSTFALDVGDRGIADAVREAMRTERGRPSNIGRRLHRLLADSGCSVVARAEATETWSGWDPDGAPTPDGCFSMEALADDLVARDQLERDGRERFVATVHEAARAGRFSMALTMHAVVATAPTS